MRQVAVGAISFSLKAFALTSGGLTSVNAKMRKLAERRSSRSGKVLAAAAKARAFKRKGEAGEAGDTVVVTPKGEKILVKASKQPQYTNSIAAAFGAMGSYGADLRDYREDVRHTARQIRKASERAADDFDPEKKTVFLIITVGQAIRNFLLSDFYRMMREQYNIVILSPYATSREFRQRYEQPGVHVLPWFSRHKPRFERVFLYYLMKESGSGTHKGWLKNLEERAKAAEEDRFVKHQKMSRASNALGAMLGRDGLLALYQSYMVAVLPKDIFSFLFERYQPALVISTAAHHSEAWPLTYYARRYGAKTLCNILSWDNTTTKPAMDPTCDICTVWSEEMADEIARHFSVNMKTRVTGSPLFDMYYNRNGALDRASFLTGLGLSPDLPYILYTTNTPAATSDEHLIVMEYWQAICRSPLAGKVSLLVRLHPKQNKAPYASLVGQKDVAVTLAGQPLWGGADRWIPGDKDMELLLNSMMHAAVSVNIASTMSLESFALGLPTINVALRASDDVKISALMWSFDMFHTSDHYKAIVENGAVDLAHTMDELVALTIDAIENGPRHGEAMQRTLEQKAAYCDGTSAMRLFEVVQEMIEPQAQVREVPCPAPSSNVAVAPPASNGAVPAPATLPQSTSGRWAGLPRPAQAMTELHAEAEGTR